MIASYGAQLLEWLEKYTFVEEQKFADPAHAARNAEFFLDELARNGTTTALAYCTEHPGSADALFAAAHRRNAGMIAGNAIMNRNGPPGLLARRHGHRRQPRSHPPLARHRPAALRRDAALRHHVDGRAARGSGRAAEGIPDRLMQTHLAENHNEIATVKRCSLNDPSYTAVYARFGLLGPRSLMGHCIHLADDEVALLRDSQAVAVFCPTSNLFIGSGLFD